MDCVQVPGGHVLGHGRRGPRPRAHRPGTEHRHAAVPARRRLHRQVSDVGFPVHRDAERAAVELPGGRR